ncbi:MAG: hypothetical protein RR975_13015, partial [Clostridia bacterium]
MKKSLVLVLTMLLCSILIGSALADVGCGNQHYFDCGGGVGNDGTEYHNPGTSQKFRCYAHNTINKKTSVCTTHSNCKVTTGDVWHSYKCMKCTYGSDGSYQS